MSNWISTIPSKYAGGDLGGLSREVWLLYFRIPLTVINSIGIVANILLFVMLLLLRSRQEISEAGLIVLVNQSFIDFFNVSFAIIYTLVDVNSMPVTSEDLEWVRAAICLGWHTQYPYWIAYGVSVFNEMILSFERYIAIVHQFKQHKFRSILPGLIAINYLMNFVFNLPYITYNEYNYETRECSSRYFDGTFYFLRWYAALWAFEAYLLPGLGLLYFNLKSIITLRKSDKVLVTSVSMPKRLGLKTKASALLFKTAAVSLSYYLTMTYVTYFYVTQSLDGFYDTYDVRNIIGTSLATVHFSLNPIIALFFLPGIRRSSVSLLSMQKVEIL